MRGHRRKLRSRLASSIPKAWRHEHGTSHNRHQHGVAAAGHRSDTGDDIGLDGLDAKFDTKFDGLDAKFDTKFDGLDAKFDTRIDGLDKKFDTRIDGLDAKFETRIDGLDKKFTGEFRTVHGELRIMRREISNVGERLARVEGHLMGPESFSSSPLPPPPDELDDSARQAI